MHIPSTKLERFARDVIVQCTQSQPSRINRGMAYKNYYLLGAENADVPALFNKTYVYLDDLESLLYSPVSLAWHIGDPSMPNALEQAKGRAAATRLKHHTRFSETDTKISQAVCWSLVKGKTFIKQHWSRDKFQPAVIQPEMMGVFMEAHDCLDENMEAFVHSTWITPYQYARLLWNIKDKAVRDELMRKGKRYQKPGKQAIVDADQAMKQVIVGGLYPYQPSGSQKPQTRGIVDWMGGPSPILSADLVGSLMRLDELWVWDDARQDWATFQMIGDDILLMGRLLIQNALAFNPASLQSVPELKGQHPFTEFCANPLDGYFWGRSEIANVALLQESLNSRMAGINRLLRLQEDPPKKFMGSSGVNQNALARFRKPGGYWTDSSPTAKVETDSPQIPETLWESNHEIERLFDEMGGLPPIAKGRGEAGVRSQGHAETLVRMFSPRFKDRALLIERDVEALGQLMLQIGRAHDDCRLIGWVAEQYAGLEKKIEPDAFLIPPAPGMAPVQFSLHDLSENSRVSVESHSSSPAFQMEARGLAFDLLKIGAADQVDVVDRIDVSNPEELVANIERRQAEKAAAISKLEGQEQLKLLEGGKKK
jgi:hypothetical protein